MTEYAFPCIHEIDGNWQKEPSEEHRGMSLRDYFAAKALVGSLVGTECLMADTKDALAGWCYNMADAMLEARKK